MQVSWNSQPAFHSPCRSRVSPTHPLSALQYRELQGAESSEFLQCFPTGVQYLAGGVESGFTHVERDSWPTRLLHIKGRRNVRVLEVPLSLSSLNSGDVFLLDAGLTLYQWNGGEASRAEKAKGAQIAQCIKDDERGGRAALRLLAEGDSSPEMVAFLALLGYSGAPDKVVIATADEGGADDAADVAAAAPRLYKQPPGGSIAANNEITARPLERSLLDPAAVCVLVSGGAAYAWVGKRAGAEDKKRALVTAGEAAAAAGLSAQASLKVVKEGTEPALFTQAFHRWAAISLPTPEQLGRTPSGTIRRASEVVDVEALVRSAKRAAADDNADGDAQVVEQPGSGELTVWRIENFERAPVPKEQYGQLYSGDSYVILYTYKDGSNRPAAFIYFWQGRDSSADERAAAALQAKALDDSMGGYPVQVRVVQGSEPAHFHKLFGGHMVVHTGGVASGFKNANQASTDNAGSATALYHVRGTTAFNTHAVQVVSKAGSLNSGDCFVLLVPRTKAAVWQGKYSSPEEQACAQGVATRLAPLYGLPNGAEGVSVAEGQEPDWFWEALGGKGEYAAVDGDAPPPSQAPRLFQLCDAAAGGMGVRCEEVFNYSQDDLCDDDVMLLDVGNTVFLWVGNGATENEKASSQQLAERYIAAASAADGRSPDTPVLSVRAGAEPPMFKCHFIGWDDTKAAAFVDPALMRQNSLAEAAAKVVAEKEAAAAAASAKAAAAVAALELQRKEKAQPVAEAADAAPASAPAPVGRASVTVPPGSKIVPLAQLKELREDSGLDLTAKETYLSDAEFAQALGCSKADFAKLPKWKQGDAKKKAGIY